MGLGVIVFHPICWLNMLTINNLTNVKLFRALQIQVLAINYIYYWSINNWRSEEGNSEYIRRRLGSHRRCRSRNPDYQASVGGICYLYRRWRRLSFCSGEKTKPEQRSADPPLPLSSVTCDLWECWLVIKSLPSLPPSLLHYEVSDSR